MMKKPRKHKSKPMRNAPCPCGSGQKYKRCHGGLAPSRPSIDYHKVFDAAEQAYAEHKAKEIRRIDMQGKGTPIISEEFHGQRIVAVRQKIYYSDNWLTFHDFLFDYLRILISSIAGENFLDLIKKEQHPIYTWYIECVRIKKSLFKDSSAETYSVPFNGYTSSYMNLAYSLYLIQHNLELQELIVHRLLKKDHFIGARYECYVLGEFIKAGYSIELEDETDGTSSHVEFVAVSEKSGHKFSVEAKARMPGKQHKVIRNQIAKALRKSATHPRIVFIDLNVSDRITDVDKPGWPSEVCKGIRDIESSLMIKGEKPEPAYIFVTNDPDLYAPMEVSNGSAFCVDGFLIDDFGFEMEFESIRKAVEAKDRHKPIFDLRDSMIKHRSIPATFDHSVPSYINQDIQNPLTIGSEYLIPAQDGSEVTGTLLEAEIDQENKKVIGIFGTPNEKSLICSIPISEIELQAYKDHPDTFFGVHRPRPKKIEDAVDLYHFFYDCYKETPKSRLLELMKNSKDIKVLSKLPQDELAKFYSERMTESADRQSRKMTRVKKETIMDTHII